MTKATTRARYTLEFKQVAVRLVEGGQSIAAAASTLCVVDQTLFNWVKAHRAGKLTGADSKVVSAEKMEIIRLRAELVAMAVLPVPKPRTNFSQGDKAGLVLGPVAVATVLAEDSSATRSWLPI